MKKLLITISPLCVIFFVFTWISLGPEWAFMFLGVSLFTTVGIILLAKWAEFVDKHIKD